MKTVYASAIVLVALIGAACQKTESPTDVPAPQTPAASTPATEASTPTAEKPRKYSNEELEALGTEARDAAMLLGSELKAELMAAIEANGPVGGVTVCSEKAQSIAARISEETGLEVGRVSEKARNPLNQPDAWETETFERFATAHGNNYKYEALERFRVIEQDGQQVFRFMKPIIMGDICTTCHGKDIPEDVQAAIRAAYPEDQATGFEPGELRGAFTVSKVLN